jgi:hypothetical protein
MSKKKPITILRNLLNSGIKLLGDAEYQMRIWVQGKGPEVDSYDEAVMYFLDTCEDIFKAPLEYDGIDSTNLVSLKDLYEKVLRYNNAIYHERNSEDVARILRDPQWHEIQKSAQKVYKILKASVEKVIDG